MKTRKRYVGAGLVAGAAMMMLLAACGPADGDASEPSPAPMTSTAAGPSPVAETSSPSTSAATATSAASPSPTVEPARCAGDPEFPDGAEDERLCAVDPEGATELPAGDLGAAVILTPSKNIWCTLDEDLVDCSMVDPMVRIDLEAEGEAYEPDRDDGPAGVEPTTLEYGDAITYGPFACLSQEKGLACWSRDSGHGLFLSRAHQQRW